MNLPITLTSPENRFTHCVFSPDGAVAATGTGLGAVAIWNAHTHAMMRGYNIIRSRIRCMVFTHDGTRVFVAYSTNAINRVSAVILRHADCVPVLQLQDVVGNINCCAFSSDDTTLIIASNSIIVHVMSTADGAILNTLRGHTELVSHCIFLSDDVHAVSASSDRTVRVWNTTAGTRVHVLRGHTGAITGCALYGSSTVITSSYDGTIRMWDALGGFCVRTIHTDPVTDIALAPDSACLAVCVSPYVRVWDTLTCTCVHTLYVAYPHVNSVTFLPESDEIVMLPALGSVRIQAIPPNLTRRHGSVLLMVLMGLQGRHRLPAELWRFITDEFL